MKKIVSILFIIITASIYAQPEFSKLNSMPGSFSRIGFGPRGIGMANSMSAVIDGNLVSYYNPAVSAFQENNSFQVGYSILSLDRSLNFLSFTRKFDFYGKDTSANKKPRSSAGISMGIINSGVGNIDGRDNQGIKTGDLSTSENQFFLGLSNKFSEKFSLGISVKFYYYKLYEDITSTGLGLDIGALYRFNDNWSAAIVLTDLNSKYKWDTAPLYGQNGTSTQDNFPNLRKAAVAYSDKEAGLIATAEFENSNAKTNFLRVGIEYNIYDNLFLRGGIDRVSISNPDIPIKPALGFSYSKYIGKFLAGIEYAFMIEQYSPQDRHIIGVNLNF